MAKKKWQEAYPALPLCPVRRGSKKKVEKRKGEHFPRHNFLLGNNLGKIRKNQDNFLDSFPIILYCQLLPESEQGGGCFRVELPRIAPMFFTSSKASLKTAVSSCGETVRSILRRIFSDGVGRESHPSIPTVTQRNHLSLIYAGLFAVVAVSLGCRQKASPLMPVKKELLSVPEAEKHLGILKGRASLSVSFDFKNCSDRTIYLETGRASCGCVGVKVEGGTILLPEKSGRVSLEVDMQDHSSGGRFAEYVPLFARLHPPTFSGESAITDAEGTSGQSADTVEVHSLRVAGVREGVAVEGDKYVIRERMLAKKGISPIRLLVYRETDSTPFELVSVACTIPGIQPELTQATTLRSWATDDCFMSRVVIPVRVIENISNSRGDFIINYRLRGEAKQLRAECLVLSKGDI